MNEPGNHVRTLQYRLKPLAANYVEEGERRAFGLFGAALQLGDVAHAQIERTGKCSLAHVRAFPQAANLFGADGSGCRGRFDTKVANRNFVVSLVVHHADSVHPLCGFKKCLGDFAKLLCHMEPRLAGRLVSRMRFVHLGLESKFFQCHALSPSPFL